MGKSGVGIPVSRWKGPDVGSQADSLLEQANALEDGQNAVLESSSLALQYNAALAAEVEAKEEQVGRIEDRLEALIDEQAARLQQTRTAQPGLFAMPGAKARWQAQVLQQESSLQRLQGRLEAVREVKEGMGLHGPRLEEMAARKVRIEHPDLVKEWEALMQAQRLHEALMSKQEQERRQSHMRADEGASAVRGLTVGILR